MITKIENYFLNQRMDGAPDLTEFDSEQYIMFEAAGMKRILKDEKIYNGHDINFLGSIWNTVIGATQGKIYKVSIQHISPDRNKSDVLFQKTLEYLKKEMGKHSEHPFLSKKYVWDSADGNVFLHHVHKFGVNSINLFLTSSSIREQMKIEHTL